MNHSRHSLSSPPKSASPGQAIGMLTATLMLTLATAIGLRAVLPPDALAPAVATLLFVSAAAVGGIAQLRRRTRQARGLDLAGILTFVGVVISIMIESDQMTRLVTLSQHPD